MEQIPDVLESARFVTQRARAVRIDEGAVRAWADCQCVGEFDTPGVPAELEFTGSDQACANLTLLLSALNFCFWSKEPWSVDYRSRSWTRTYAMVASMLRAVQRDSAWLSPDRWAEADDRTVAELFRGRGEIPMLPERRAVMNETGRCLLDKFHGRFSEAVKRVDRRARDLAYLLAEEFPSFRDVATYDGRPVAILKRAQICASDLHRLYTRNRHDGLQRLDDLTVFADYRLPQYLRHVGIIQVDDQLAGRIERREHLVAGCDEEIELRCATIVAGNLLQRALGGQIPAWRLDYVLWLKSHDPQVQLQHHRTRTIRY